MGPRPNFGLAPEIFGHYPPNFTTDRPVHKLVSRMENSSSSQLKPLSCIPCAKRKVRCDRAFPCQHCKRRKGDVCTYPVPKTGHQWSPPTPVRSDEAATPTDPFSSSSSRGTKRSRDTSIHDNDPTYRSIQADPAYRSIQAGLVEHDDQSNYIEAPVWYSWSEARTLANEKSVQLPIANGLDGYHGTLLDVSSPINAEPRFCHPSSEHIDILWRAFLDNVHPLVMVFFNWAKEPILRHAARDPAGLSSSEHAFCFSIYAMATLSMTEQECEAIFVERSKSSMLDKYQSALETALVVNNYASTSNILVLQALVLYLVRVSRSLHLHPLTAPRSSCAIAPHHQRSSLSSASSSALHNASVSTAMAPSSTSLPLSPKNGVEYGGKSNTWKFPRPSFSARSQ